MNVVDVEQGSIEWRRACSGSLGSTTMPALVRRNKDGTPSASRRNTIAVKLLERFTGVLIDTVVPSLAMRQGTQREPEARWGYEIMNNVEVMRVGLVRHPRIPWAHSSPDGLVGTEGGVEIKSPQHGAHLETLETERIDPDYLVQCQWHMSVTERTWWDYVSYNPDFPAGAIFWIKRLERDSAMISFLEEEAYRALEEIEQKIAFLKERYGVR
jgi:hypothetical protein